MNQSMDIRSTLLSIFEILMKNKTPIVIRGRCVFIFIIINTVQIEFASTISQLFVHYFILSSMNFSE